MPKHVAVLMGGWSVERPVSLNSGKACADALEGEGYKVTRVDVQRDIAEVLAKLKPDVAFNALHGRFGEDGSIQGLLEVLRIPYTHSGVLASALAIDKARAKVMLASCGVPVVAGKVVSRFEASKAHVLPPPYVLKPVNEGSSFGVVIVREGREHPPQEIAREDWPHAEWLLAESFVPGRELTCGVMGDKPMDIIDIRASTGAFYDYDAKYAPGGSTHLLPAPVSAEVYEACRRIALAAHNALSCRGVSRADFRYDDSKPGLEGLACLEVNTQPGMAATSLVPELAAHAGMSFEELVSWMVEDASLGR